MLFGSQQDCTNCVRIAWPDPHLPAEWHSHPFTNGFIHQCYMKAETPRERAEGSGFEGCLTIEDLNGAVLYLAQ